MQKTLIVAVALLVLFPLTSQAQSLIGAWTLEQAEVTGGAHPGTFTEPGLIIFTPTHYSLMYVPRPRAEFTEDTTDAERLAALVAVIGNGGTYTRSGSTLTMHLMVAKSPNQINTVRTWEIRFEGDDIVWFTFQAPGRANFTQKWVRAE